MDEKVTPTTKFLGSQFTSANSTTSDYFLKLKANIELLLKGLQQYDSQEVVNTPEAEADIKNKFQQFLLGCEFNMGLSDFDDLLEESNKPREDGSIAWYHQLTPVLIFLSMIQDGTISLDELNQYGGLETAIRTALRHDSIEDFGKSFEQFESYQKQQIEKTLSKLKNMGLPADSNKRAEEYKNLEFLMENLKLMTKKIAVLNSEGIPMHHPDGRIIKHSLFPDTRSYIHNMIDSENASPVVWILKVCDGIHNLSTMIGAPKFTAPRRLEYSNQREDMYGSRQGLPEFAMEKWPDFADAIRKVDHLMGCVLYTNFGYLEYVDQDKAYPNDKTKFRDGDTPHSLGIAKYLKDSLSISIPNGFNPFYSLLNTIKTQIAKNPDFIEAARTKVFWERSIIPTLKNHASYFPKIFSQTNASWTFSNQANQAPNFL